MKGTANRFVVLVILADRSLQSQERHPELRRAAIFVWLPLLKTQ